MHRAGAALPGRGSGSLAPASSTAWREGAPEADQLALGLQTPPPLPYTRASPQTTFRHTLGGRNLSTPALHLRPTLKYLHIKRPRTVKLSKGDDQSAVIFEFNPFVASVVLRGIREIKIKMETNYIFVAVVF